MRQICHNELQRGVPKWVHQPSQSHQTFLSLLRYDSSIKRVHLAHLK